MTKPLRILLNYNGVPMWRGCCDGCAWFNPGDVHERRFVRVDYPADPAKPGSGASWTKEEQVLLTNLGTCHRHPPRIMRHRGGKLPDGTHIISHPIVAGGYASVWPIVDPMDTCGEWQSPAAGAEVADDIEIVDGKPRRRKEVAP